MLMKIKEKEPTPLWVKIVGTLIIGPIVLIIIIGLIAALVKFTQICMNWIGV
jgi:hypothetical protein